MFFVMEEPRSFINNSKAHQASNIIWGSLKCFIAAEEMLEIGIKDHQIVVGAYSTWLVSNSGRKEALEATRKVASLDQQLNELSSDVSSVQSTVSSLSGTVTTIKKTVDTKLSQLGKKS